MCQPPEELKEAGNRLRVASGLLPDFHKAGDVLLDDDGDKQDIERGRVSGRRLIPLSLARTGMWGNM